MSNCQSKKNGIQVLNWSLAPATYDAAQLQSSPLTILLRVALSKTVSVDVMSYLQGDHAESDTNFCLFVVVFFYFMAENTQNGHHTVTQSRRENGRQHSRHTLMIGAQEKKLWAFLCGDCHFHNCKTLNCSLEVNWGPTVIFECGGTYRWSLSLMKGCLSVLKWACVCGSRWTSKSGMSGWNGVFILAAKESHIPAIPALFRSSHFWSVDTKQNNKKRQTNKQNIAFRIGMGHN